MGYGKYLLGGAVGAAATYLLMKSQESAAATSAANKQLATAPAPAQQGPQAFTAMLDADGAHPLSAPLGSVVLASNGYGIQWGGNMVQSDNPNVLTQVGVSTFTATGKGTANLTGDALDANGNSFPVKATVTIS